METLINLLSLVGSLGLFLYGMKIMSEGLEKFAGDKLRNILSAMTKNRFMGVLTGVLVTALIQSSSATTVMVVSFVNAGLMTLKQSIGVIMGANIGTTVTAWIISAVGFKVNISAFAVPLLAFGLPLLFSKEGKRKNLGEFIFGFSFLFMGLSLLQEAANAIHIDVLVANMLANVPTGSFLTIILFILVGALVTMLVQASAATMAITLMLFSMNIPGFGLEEACALAMGQNIGTTITAVLASLTANTQARRAALAHMFFNVFGVVVVLLFFKPAVHGVSWFVTDVMHSTGNDLFKLSAFHSAFNIFNTILLIGFTSQIEQFVCRMLPMKEEDMEYRLHYISAGLLSTAEISILEAEKEVNNFAERCQRMFGIVRTLLQTKDEKEFNKQFTRVEKYEAITDRMEIEIANYLNRVSEGRLSNESKAQIQKMLKQISELESIGDSCYKLARTIFRKRQQEAEFSNDQMRHIYDMMGLVDQALTEMVKKVELNSMNIRITESLNIENEINNYRAQLKEQNLQDVNAGIYSYQTGVLYIDFVSECEKVGDYVMNVVQAGKGQNNSDPERKE